MLARVLLNGLGSALSRPVEVDATCPAFTPSQFTVWVFLTSAGGTRPKNEVVLRMEGLRADVDESRPVIGMVVRLRHLPQRPGGTAAPLSRTGARLMEQTLPKVEAASSSPVSRSSTSVRLQLN